jgi:predicted transposase/invertase (TIGR01784 family)
MPITDKYINPLTDFGFKKLFGTESNKDLLVDFLNQLLPEKHQINDLNFYQNEQLPKDRKDRIAIFDIFCKSKTGEEFIVEIQRKRQDFFKDRSIFYSTFPIQRNATKGKDFDFRLPVIYTIAILDFTFDDYKNDLKFVHHIKLKDELGKVFYDKLSYIYIELPKFTKKIEELETLFEKWLFVLKWLSNLQTRPAALQERVFQKLFKQAEIAKYNKMERAQYEQSLKQYRDMQNVVSYAEKKGMEKGREEERLELIQNGLSKGYSIETIADFTKLTTDEVKIIIVEQGWEIN